MTLLRLLFTLITMGFVIFIMFSVFDDLQETMDNDAVYYNVTSATATSVEAISSMFPIMMVIMVGITILIIASSIIKSFVGGTDDYGDYVEEEHEEPKQVPQEPEKETYEDYVKERIRVEQMMGPFGRFLAWRKGK
jgi:hypothetical protein